MLTDIIKDIIPLTVGITSLDIITTFFVPSIIGDLSFSRNFLKTDRKAILRYSNLPSDLNALDYLNLASSLVHNYSRGDGSCKEFAGATFQVYNILLKLNNRKDLLKDIRGCLGFDGECGHAFLEVRHKGKFVNYETTDYTPPLLVDKIKSYSQRSLFKKQKLNLEENAQIFSKCINVPGTRLALFSPTLKFFSTHNKLLIAAFKNLIK